MKIKNVKKEYEEYVKQECKLHVDKEKGKEHCASVILGDTISIQIMLASLFEALTKHDVLDCDDLRHVVDIVEKVGNKNESK